MVRFPLPAPLEDDEIKRSDSIYRDVYEELPIGTAIVSSDGRFVRGNKAFCQLTGYAEAELTAITFADITHPDDVPAHLEGVKQLLAGETDRYSTERRYRCKTGDTIWARTYVQMMGDHGSRTQSFLVLVEDVTDRKRAQDELQKSEKQYRQITESLNEGIWAIDQDAFTTYANERMADMLGYTSEEMLGKHLFDFMDERGVEISKRNLERRRQGIKEDHEFELLHKDGSRIHTIMQASPLTDGRGRYAGALAGVLDITDRKLAEQKLQHVQQELEERIAERTADIERANLELMEEIEERRHAETLFRQLLESAPDAMIVTDPHGKIMLVNDVTEKLFGYPREELIGQPIEILVPERFRGDHHGHRNAYAKNPHVRPMGQGFDLPAVRKDGSEFPAEISLGPLRTDQGVLVFSAIRDVTERKKIEEEIKTNLSIQSITSSILRLSLEQIDLEELLRRTLELLVSTPWLSLEKKGAIFLADEKARELRMTTNIGLPDAMLEVCSRRPYGECLCGQAALTRRVVFVDAVDHRHEVVHEGMNPHGHYCVPIVSDEQLLGVLTLYVPEGHKHNPKEELFLTSVADVLAGAIKRLEAEHALRSSEERFDLAVSGTDAGIWDWDLQTNRVYFSARWKGMLGYGEDEIENEFSEWEKRVHPDDEQRARETIQAYLDGRTGEYELEHRLRHKNGSYRHILARGAAVRDRNGKMYRMVGSHIDITESRRQQELLKENEAQLRAAQRIQEHLLPDKAPAIPGYDIAGASIPADFAAGDHYDYFTMSDESLGIVVGDVSGHGFSSALLMASVHAHLRSLAGIGLEIDEIMARANSSLIRETAPGHFVTAILARLVPDSRELKYVSAGHPTGLVLDRTGRLKAELKSTSLPLAIVPHASFKIGETVTLESGDVVLMLTDGVLETVSPRQDFFGTERTLAVVRGALDKPATEIVRLLCQAARDFSCQDKQEDDVTAVVIKVGCAAENVSGAD